ncbi:hypothetical protein NQ317_007609 [Molorchus minor]|uniref:Peptidase A2 domain-containing protein n=1 Tax=Molorchus minor TaxID=1323400 RepID=A0ABQ9JPI4_9CUCU|nr:hypothetical protein NQ317_007609 [Molorchus minor]
MCQELSANRQREGKSDQKNAKEEVVTETHQALANSTNQHVFLQTLRVKMGNSERKRYCTTVQQQKETRLVQDRPAILKPLYLKYHEGSTVYHQCSSRRNPPSPGSSGNSSSNCTTGITKEESYWKDQAYSYLMNNLAADLLNGLESSINDHHPVIQINNSDDVENADSSSDSDNSIDRSFNRNSNSNFRIMSNEVNYQLLKMYIDIIPKFDGTPSFLNDFINSSQELYNSFNDPSNAAQSLFLVRAIKSKLTGQAQIISSSRLELNSWPEIKNLLLENFGDPRDLPCLQQDLLHLTFYKSNDNIQSFGTKIQQFQSLLMSKLQQSEKSEAVKRALSEVYQQLALDTYVRNLPSHYQQMVRTKGCESLEDAISFVLKEEQFSQYKNSSASEYPNITYESNSMLTPCSLPYIVIANPPLKLLIDTGCSKSMIRPSIVHHYYPECIFRYDTKIKTCNGETTIQYRAEIPAFSEFQSADTMDVLVNPSETAMSYSIEAHETIVKPIPIDASDDLEIYIPRQNSPSCYIPDTITTVKKGFALVEIHNISDDATTVRFDNPVDFQPLSEYHPNPGSINNEIDEALENDVEPDPDALDAILENIDNLCSPELLPAKKLPREVSEQNPDVSETHDDNDTVHTANENPILTIPYTESPLNHYKNQIILTESNSTPREIGHLNKNTPFEMNENAIITDYIQNHKEITQQLYDNVKDKISTSKENVISTQNQKRENPQQNLENETIYIKSRDVRHKTEPKFKKSKVVQDKGPTLLTKDGHYHKNIIKRRRKITKSVPLQEPGHSKTSTETTKRHETITPETDTPISLKPIISTLEISKAHLSQLQPNVLTDQCGYIIQKIEDKLNNFQPHFRQKRGLINAVGKAYKYLFGTLDEDDLVNINKKFNVLLQNQKDIATQVNSRMSLLTTFVEKTNSTINTIWNNQQKIQTALEELQHTNSELENYILSQNLLNSLELILEYIDTLENAITLIEVFSQCQDVSLRRISRPTEIRLTPDCLIKINNLTYHVQPTLHNGSSFLLPELLPTPKSSTNSPIRLHKVKFDDIFEYHKKLQALKPITVQDLPEDEENSSNIFIFIAIAIGIILCLIALIWCKRRNNSTKLAVTFSKDLANTSSKRKDNSESEKNHTRFSCALIDTGSQKTYILKSTAEFLRYRTKRSINIIHGLFGGSELSQRHDCYDVTVSNDNYSCTFEALDQPVICNGISAVFYGIRMEELRLKAIHGKKICSEMRTGGDRNVTRLDFGGQDTPGKTSKLVHDFYFLFINNASITNLWELDVLGINDPAERMTCEETALAAKEVFLETVTIDVDGRYEVRLPWLKGHPALPSNYQMAKKRLEKVINDG